MSSWSGEEPVVDRGLSIRGAAIPSWGAAAVASLIRRLGAVAAMAGLGLALLTVVGLSWGLLWLLLGASVQVPGNSGLRWLALGLAQLVVPGAMVVLLPLVQRVLPLVMQLMCEGGGPRAGVVDSAVAGRLDPGEHVLASMALDKVFGPCEWAWSQVVVWTVLSGSLTVLVWAAVLAQFEPVYAAVYAPAAVVGLLLGVWAAQGLVSLDVVSELVVGVLPPLLAMVLWPIVPRGMAAAGLPLKVLLGVQSLWVLVRLLGRFRGGALVLTSRGFRRVDGLTRAGRAQVGPVLRPVMISAGPAPLGERWLWSEEGGGAGLLFPILASARSVARVAESAGVELKVRPDARAASGATVTTVVGAFVVVLWYVVVALPPAHLSVSLALDLAFRAGELSSSPGPVMVGCDALATQHPLAIVPRCMAAQGWTLEGAPDAAQTRFDEVEQLLSLVPGVTKDTLPPVARTLVVCVGRDLALRRRCALNEAEGWEPAGEALASYRQAMLALFGWNGGDPAERVATARGLLEETRALAPQAAGPPFMLAYLHLRHWDRGVQVDDSLHRLVEQASDEAKVARKLLAPLAGGGPWAAAAAALGSVPGLLSERQVALGLVVERVEEGSVSSRGLALSLVQAVREGSVVHVEAFGDLAVKPPSSGEEFLERWRKPERLKIRGAQLWAQAEGTGPLDETTWLPKLMQELSLKVPVRVAGRVRSEPGLAWLRPFLPRAEESDR